MQCLFDARYNLFEMCSNHCLHGVRYNTYIVVHSDLNCRLKLSSGIGHALCM